jgi:hypothetical protein
MEFASSFEKDKNFNFKSKWLHKKLHHVELSFKSPLESNVLWIKQNLGLWYPTLLTLGNFSHVVASRRFPKNIEKMNLESILNKRSP